MHAWTHNIVQFHTGFKSIPRKKIKEEEEEGVD